MGNALTPNKKAPGNVEFPGVFSRIQAIVIPLYWCNIRRLKTLGPLDDIETYFLIFVESLEPFRVDRGIMNENIRSIFLFNKPETLGFVEPLDLTLCHLTVLLQQK